ncbi:tubulin-specific chaperone a-like [Moniliophthora roreri]|uniref:Tubulin-specific chaperone A n=1 Tax=Moniliophthora roreri TaxID=221103 RepID=A0A0W0FRM4_MONRR|nr:tubulin-specific chaperone a-like [Moniliophthora roreri]
MSNNMESLKRQLGIKSGAVKCLLKENAFCREEAQLLKLKLDKLIADGIPSDQWEVKDATRLYEESNQMIQDSSNRLGSVVGELRDVLIAAKKEPHLAEDAEFLNAEGVLEEASL